MDIGPTGIAGTRKIAHSIAPGLGRRSGFLTHLGKNSGHVGERFMESLQSLWRMHWDHEPRNWSAGLRPGAIASQVRSPMPDQGPRSERTERGLSQAAAVTQAKVPSDGPRRIRVRRRCGVGHSALRFMESL